MQIKLVSYNPLTKALRFKIGLERNEIFNQQSLALQVLCYEGQFDNKTGIYTIEKSLLKGVLLDAGVELEVANALTAEVDNKTSAKYILEVHFPDAFLNIEQGNLKQRPRLLKYQIKVQIVKTAESLTYENILRLLWICDYGHMNDYQLMIITLIKEGSLERIKEEKFNINNLRSPDFMDGSSRSLAYWLRKKNHTDVIDYLYNYEQTVAVQPNLLYSQVSLAIMLGKTVSEISGLIQSGASLTISPSETHPLHVAVDEELGEVVNFLMTLPIPRATPKFMGIALINAAKKGSKECEGIVVSLCEHMTADEINFSLPDGTTALIASVKSGNVNMVKHLCSLEDKNINISSTAISIVLKRISSLEDRLKRVRNNLKNNGFDVDPAVSDVLESRTLATDEEILDTLITAVNDPKKDEIIVLLKIKNRVDNSELDKAGYGFFGRKTPYNIEQLRIALKNFTATADDKIIYEALKAVDNVFINRQPSRYSRKDSVDSLYATLIEYTKKVSERQSFGLG